MLVALLADDADEVRSGNFELVRFTKLKQFFQMITEHWKILRQEVRNWYSPACILHVEAGGFAGDIANHNSIVAANRTKTDTPHKLPMNSWDRPRVKGKRITFAQSYPAESGTWKFIAEVRSVAPIHHLAKTC